MLPAGSTARAHPCLVIRVTGSLTLELWAATACPDRAGCGPPAARTAQDPPSSPICPIPRPCKVPEPSNDFYTHRGIIALSTPPRAVSHAYRAAQAAPVRLRVAHSESAIHSSIPSPTGRCPSSARAPGGPSRARAGWASPYQAASCVWMISGSGCRLHPRLFDVDLSSCPRRFDSRAPRLARFSRTPRIPSDRHVSLLLTRRPVARGAGEFAARRTVLAMGHGMDGGSCAFLFVMLSTRLRSRRPTPLTAAAANNIVAKAE
ncbi:hypothetical protein AURDEDRAFT_176081 [Auricularia subglabra TFB-10046 SS5]|nr:hypothetical protein AURDEDRAFT_176081 [Auricularia subglabra TFB-10046 SS5]